MKNGSVVGFLGSLLCVVAVAAVMVLTARTGFDYWNGVGDVFNAWLTVFFEVIALGGLAAAKMHSGKWSVLGWLVAIALTATAAGWCGFTQWERLKSEAHAHAVAVAENTEVYKMARADWLDARAATERYDATDPRPGCNCPQTIVAWQQTHAAEATRLESVVTARQTRMQALVPEATLDPLAIARAIIIEIMKLLGFVAFGAGLRMVGGSQPEAAAVKAAPKRVRKPAPQAAPKPAPGPPKLAVVPAQKHAAAPTRKYGWGLVGQAKGPPRAGGM